VLGKTSDDWNALIGRIARKGKGPSLTASEVERVSDQLIAPLPPVVQRLYTALGNGGFGPGFLPLFTGREDMPVHALPGEDPGACFERVTSASCSVLGFNMARRRKSDDYPWPHGLLEVADHGCAIYFAIDLLDPGLRVIEHEALERAEEAQLDPVSELAYVNGEVPADVRHWFVVASPSLFDWLERWLDHGVVSSRCDWAKRQ